MAAPSVGRRSCAGQKREAAALITQSRRWSYGRVKELLYDGFFLFAVVRQINCLLVIISSQFGHPQYGLSGRSSVQFPGCG